MKRKISKTDHLCHKVLVFGILDPVISDKDVFSYSSVEKKFPRFEISLAFFLQAQRSFYANSFNINKRIRKALLVSRAESKSLFVTFLGFLW